MNRGTRSLTGVAASGLVARNRWLVRVILALVLALLILLSFFPERYRAAATLTPTDPASFGLSGTLGQLGALNGVFGNQAAIEVALKVANSEAVREAVARKMKLRRRMAFADDLTMLRWMDDKMTIRSLRGGIILYETQLRDPILAKDMVGAYAAATRDRLAQISRRQTEYKRDVLVTLVTDASDRLARARAAFNAFRLATRYVNPDESVAAVSSRITSLETAIKAKEVELNASRQFATDGNLSIRRILAQLQALRLQLQQARATGQSSENSVGGAVTASTEAERLGRELRIAQTLYDSYVRFLEGTSVEDLTSTASVRLLEEPYVDTARQVDFRFAALAVLLALCWAAVEFYRLRPPVTDRAIAARPTVSG